MDYTTIGIDVSKFKLDIFFGSTGEYKTVENNRKGFNVLFNYIKRHCSDVKRIVVEHTGSYQKELVCFLQDKNLPVCLVQPLRVRSYAKTIGKLAKTDKIDAELLALYGEKMEPEISKPQPKLISDLRELVKLRKQLTDVQTLTKQWLEKNPIKQSVQEIEKLVKQLKKQISRIEKDILNLIRSDEQLTPKFEKIVQTKGTGNVTAYTLLAELPELGCLPDNKLVALCGLAPLNRDSGTMRGKACIQGGRKTVRCALYMAVISAIRTNNVIHDYYQRLKQKGKPTRVAIVACMRKLIIHLNHEVQKI